MSKKIPSAPLVTVRPPRKPGPLRKVARLGATIVAARVAAGTGKKGVLGIVAGMGAKRIIMRHPVGALMVTGAYMAGKIYEAKRAIDAKRNQKLLTDNSKDPVPIETARKKAIVEG